MALRFFMSNLLTFHTLGLVNIIIVINFVVGPAIIKVARMFFLF